MFSPHFDVFCDPLLNRRTTTWNLSVLYNEETKAMLMTSSICLSSKNEPIEMGENLTLTVCRCFHFCYHTLWTIITLFKRISLAFIDNINLFWDLDGVCRTQVYLLNWLLLSDAFTKVLSLELHLASWKLKESTSSPGTLFLLLPRCDWDEREGWEDERS